MPADPLHPPTSRPRTSALSSSNPCCLMGGISKDGGPSSHTRKPTAPLRLHLALALSSSSTPTSFPESCSMPLHFLTRLLPTSHINDATSSTSPAFRLPHSSHQWNLSPGGGVGRGLLLTPQARAALRKSQLLPCTTCSTPPALLTLPKSTATAGF